MTGPDPSQIRKLFNEVAPTYDLLNRLLSIGTDQRLRRQVARLAAPAPGALVLDICGGTGDLAVQVSQLQPECKVILLDFAEQMLRLAQRKLLTGEIYIVASDACCLPLSDGSCDAVTAGFAFRNLRDVRAGLREVARVLRPGGRLALLELFRPTGPWAPFQAALLRLGLPTVAWLVAAKRRPAYRYLAHSILQFVSRTEMTTLMHEEGFRNIEVGGGLLGLLTIIGATRR
ncbi:MAG: ubiquinone/menaquinone biosynthesis methyltransferase [Candidatus Zipacnadales bacterium]